VETASIIVPAWNEGKVLKQTMEALLCMEYDKRKCEVIVVAGGEDETYDIAMALSSIMKAFSRYVVIRQPPHGKNAAIQQGVDESRNNIIVLLDADTIVSQGWLKNMVQPIEEGDADCTIANPYPIRRNWVSDYYMVIKTYPLEKIVTFSGHAMGFRADVVENRLDYFFDKETKVGVDYLLAKRFVERGLRVLFAHEARVKTHFPSSVEYFVRCELRWLTALIGVDGINYRRLASNTAVATALILTIPINKILFILSLLFNAGYVTKRVRIFLLASRRADLNMANVFGFILLSYTYHMIGLASYIRYFLGLSKSNYLCQGQRD